MFADQNSCRVMNSPYVVVFTKLTKWLGENLRISTEISYEGCVLHCDMSKKYPCLYGACFLEVPWPEEFFSRHYKALNSAGFK